MVEKRMTSLILLLIGAACIHDPKDGTVPNRPTATGAGVTLTAPGSRPLQLPGSRSAPPVNAGSPTGSLDPANTFEHPDVETNPFDALSRAEDEGPPEIASRLHGCQKLRYGNLGRILSGLGVDISQNAMAPAAGALWQTGAQALGAANYAARVPEALQLTTAGATKLFDIFVQAAPEIIRNMPNADRCKVHGQPIAMFDSGGCTLNGISCLQGFLAYPEQKALCDRVIAQASTTQIGQIIAVASVLAAAHTCE